MPTQLPLSTEETTKALELLADSRLAREAELQKFNTEPDVEDSDEDTDSPCPIYDSFFRDGGRKTILQMTNFTSGELDALWNGIEANVRAKWNNGRGRRYQNTPKDILFMTMATLKHGGQWDFLGRMFKIKGPTFERMITRFITTISGDIVQSFVYDLDGKYSVAKLLKQKKAFRNYTYARYATDVFFQQSNRPSGNMEEGKVYYSGKHKLYGFKTEMSVLSNGMAIGFSDHYPGSKADVDIFYANVEFHQTALEKRECERDIPDMGELVDQYENSWAVLAGKGYQGGEFHVRLVHPTRKPPNGILSLADTARNKKISSDRVLVENFFGRLVGLWGVFAVKWRYGEKLYDAFMQLAVGLTNLNVRWHPSRKEDLETYTRLRN